MNRLVSIICILMSCTLFSQSKNVVMYGCIELESGCQMRQMEVSLGNWFTYVYEVSTHEGIDDVNTLLPQISNSNTDFILEYFKRNWADFNSEWKEVEVNYLRDHFPLLLTKNEKKDLNRIKSFCNMPVTGLTLEQVNNYLLWEKDQLSDLEKLEEFGEYSIELLLPDLETYKKLHHAAKRSTMDAVTASQVVGDSVNTRGCPFFNFYSETDCETKEHRIKLYGSAFGLTEVHSYFPDQKGLYNILGNVSEMTSEKGIVFGGNYTDFAKKILDVPEQKVSLPNENVGFRYLVKILPYDN